MRTSSKILTILFILSIIGLVAWAYPIVKDRYTAETETTNPSTQEKTEKPSEFTDGNQSDEIDSEDETDENPQVSEEVRNDTFVEITKTDCEDGCKNFKEEEDMTYCKQVCGLAPLQNSPAGGENCDGLEDLEKDYCLKDLAIRKTDAKICQQIDDKNIRTTCANRIMEDIIDKQMEGRNAEPL